MTKARDDKGAETKANARATTRPVARTKANEPIAKTNEDEVAEATNDHSAEVTEDALAITNNTEAAETREDAGIETEQDIRTESKEDDVTVNIYNFQKLGTEQLKSNASAASSFSMQSKPSPPKRVITRDGRWRTGLLSLQNCSVRQLSRAPFRSSRNMRRRLTRASLPI